MDNYRIGSMVRVVITHPGWEATIVSTIVGMVKREQQVDWHLAINFDVGSDNDSLDGETGFSQLSSGTYKTTNHGLTCIVTAL